MQMDPAAERHIVNTASISGLMALPLVGVYSTTKYAVVGLSESLRADLARHGIGVSVLCPGGVQTGILKAERNRPESLGGGRGRATGTVRSVAGNARADDEDMMDPAEVARAVVEGVRADDAFIFTHPRYGEILEARHREIMSAVEKARARRRGRIRRRDSVQALGAQPRPAPARSRAAAPRRPGRSASWARCGACTDARRRGARGA